MKNIWNIFVSDLKNLKKNAVSVILVVGLVLMPSMFAWYNILACWDVFNNTGNLKVAVANTDTGYESDLLPVDINIGNKVLDALRANDDFDWVITTKDDAIDGAAGGRYYAALVIPESFSQDMMSFYSNNVQAAPLVYYSNEKKSAIAPKVTDQGADQISYKINKLFAETLSDIALNEIKIILNLYSDDDFNSRVNNLIEHIGKSSEQLKQQSAAIESYCDIITACQNMISYSNDLLKQLQNASNDISSSLSSNGNNAADMTTALDETANSLGASLDLLSKNYENLSGSIDNAFANGVVSAQDTSTSLKNISSKLTEQTNRFEEINNALKELFQNDLIPNHDALSQFSALMDSSIAMQRNTIESINNAADSLNEKGNSLNTKKDEIKSVAKKCTDAIANLQTSYHDNLKPKLEDLSGELTKAIENLNDTNCKLDGVGKDLSTGMNDANSKLENARLSLQQLSSKLTNAADNLNNTYEKLKYIFNNGDIKKLKEFIGDDPSVLANALSAPVSIERHAEFASANFGSSMAPLYATLALWVGSLLSIVLIKPNPNKKTLALCNKRVHLHQIFLARFGIFAIISLLQSTVLAFGNMVFLQVQVNDPLLYLICFWVSGLVFQFIMYTLVSTFGNVGKAIAVLLLIVQVTSSGGTFPLQMLPDYASILSPLMPATYVINAMRAAMFGVYNADFWIALSELLLFALPMALMGIVLRGPFAKMNERFVAKVEKSKLI